MKIVAKQSGLFVVAVELGFPLTLLTWRFYLRHSSQVFAVELEPVSHLLMVLAPQLLILVWASLYRLRRGLPPWRQTLLIVIGQLLLGGYGGFVSNTTLPPLVLASTLLIVLRGPWSWISFGFVIAVAVSVGTVWTAIPAMLALALLNLLVGMVMYITVRMAELAIALRRSQSLLAEATVVQERARVSRDLHDKLGQELTAVGLRAELAARLMAFRPDRAAVEIGAVQQMTERVLRGVRDVIRNQWQPVFEDELSSGTALLESAGVKWKLNVSAKPYGQVSQVAGWVVREAVTNVLNHSSATQCVIATSNRDGNFILCVENDGVNGIGGRPGIGLRGVFERVSLLGGQVRYGSKSKGNFQLIVEMPIEGGNDVGKD